MAAKFVLKVSAIALMVFSCLPSPAAMLSPGDIVVALDGIPSARDGAIYKVDPVTGDRTILTGLGVGSGPDFLAFGVAVGSVNDVYFTEANLSTPAVYHLDVTTGERRIIASSTVGSGPEIYGPSDILVRSDGKLIVASVGDEALFLLDPITLERTILSGSGVGSGPVFRDPNGLAFDANGDIIATAGLTTGPSGVFRIDSFNGNREVISPFPAQIDPHYADGLVDVAVDSQGRYFVSNLGAFTTPPAVFEIDPITGERIVVSDGDRGSGPSLGRLWGIGVDAEDHILVTNSLAGEIVRIDPVTGDRVLVSSSGVGGGPQFANVLQLFDIVPVPEPVSVVLLASGMVLLMIAGCKRWQRG